MSVRIAPSILSSDFSRLGEQVGEAERAGAGVIHIDVMDGQFVPNITIGPLIVEACRRVTDLPLDVHLMIVQPERFVTDFVRAGADYVTVHAEATPHVHRAVQMVRDAGAKPGLAVNPLTPLQVFRDALPELELALVMSVDPGFGGQRFIAGSLDRLRSLRAWRDELQPDCLIEVDGGINEETAPLAARAGADLLVAGSAVFDRQRSVEENISRITAAL